MDDGTPFNASTLTISSENAINSTLYDLSSTLGESVIQVIIRLVLSFSDSNLTFTVQT